MNIHIEFSQHFPSQVLTRHRDGVVVSVPWHRLIEHILMPKANLLALDKPKGHDHASWVTQVLWWLYLHHTLLRFLVARPLMAGENSA